MLSGCIKKKAPPRGAFFIWRTLYDFIVFLVFIGWLSISCSVFALEKNCGQERIDEYAKLKRVFDGDTIELADGRRVRIIGINTTEMARDNHPSEPYAEQARLALKNQLASTPRIGIRYGVDKYDRYDRLLAHLFLSDETNVGYWLLRHGYALSIVVPPNDALKACYRHAEELAYGERLGLWAMPEVTSIEAATLPDDTRGFHLVRGMVTGIGESKRSVWINLNGNLALRIDRRDLKYFDKTLFSSLVNQVIQVRGWIHGYKNRPIMRIRHPYAIKPVRRNEAQIIE